MRRAKIVGGAAGAIRALHLRPHPEGGHYRETWRDTAKPRGSGTAIYYLLKRGEQSRWHRIDAVEIWHYYAGAPLLLRIRADRRVKTIRLGPHIADGERPQAIVPKNAWQSACSTGAWSLVGCTVSPAFEFSGFELADDYVPAPSGPRFFRK